MAIEYSAINKEGMSKQIADAIRAAIMEGRLVVDERLPSEMEIGPTFRRIATHGQRGTQAPRCAESDPHPAWFQRRGVRQSFELVGGP